MGKVKVPIMLNYKFWLFVMWVILGIVNLCGERITKLDYFLAWSVVITSLLGNWLTSVG